MNGYMGRLPIAFRPVATLTLLLALAAPARAQEQQAALAGVVRDSTGGVMPGVTVVAKSQAGVVVELQTSVEGTYRFPSLPVGTYELTARLDGFVPANVQGIDLRLGRQLTIDL